MSLVPRCTVCDAPVANPYAPDARCERCQQPCPACNGDVAYCKHPLPKVAIPYDRMSIEERPDGSARVAA